MGRRFQRERTTSTKSRVTGRYVHRIAPSCGFDRAISSYTHPGSGPERHGPDLASGGVCGLASGGGGGG
jgi:hypothetical protein